jgi:excisionase family DNA binding protein
MKKVIDEIIRKLIKEELQNFKEELLQDLKESRLQSIHNEQYNETLTANEAAQILNVSKTKVYELARTSKLPHKKIGSRIIIPTRSFFNWLEDSNMT